MSGPPDIVLFFGRLHPLLVHLPIGFIILLALVELAACFPRFAKLRDSSGFILTLAAPAAIVTATCGWLLSLAGGYQDHLLAWHKWMGIATAGACTLAALLYLLKWKRLYRVCLAITAAVLVVASHFGGSLTHGSDYLVRYAPAPLRAWLGVAPDLAPSGNKSFSLADAPVFAGVIQPILQQNCVVCHGPEKAKAGLRLDSLPGLLKGSENGAVVVAGKTADSVLLKRVLLPPDSDDHMPPDGKPQPSTDDLALLQWWVTAGTPGNTRVGDLKPPADIEHILEARLGPPKAAMNAAPPKSLAEVLPLANQVADDLNILISPIAQNEPWLQANARSAGTNFTDATLAKLAPLAANLRWLDLAGTGVTDTGLTTLAAMPHLTRLHLERTAATDAGLTSLAGLRELEYLNLYATAVSDAGLRALKVLPKLRQLYLWQTKVTVDAAKAFADARVDQRQLQAWRDEIEQLRAKIKGGQMLVDLGTATTNSTPATNTATAAASVAAAKPANTVCPVSGQPVDPAQTVVYEGRVVAFCCGDCKAKFQQNPKAFLAKLNLVATPAGTNQAKSP